MRKYMWMAEIMKKLLMSMCMFLFFMLPLSTVNAEIKCPDGTYAFDENAQSADGKSTTTICKPLPVFPDGSSETSICTYDGSTVSCNRKLFLAPCELFEMAVRAEERKSPTGIGAHSSYTCQEFPDPIPATAVTGSSDSLCITLGDGYKSTLAPNSNTNIPYLTQKKVSNSANAYCNAIAMRTTGPFDMLFTLVSFIFLVAQPILIIAAVGMMIRSGVNYMYAGGGSSEDAIKKIREEFTQVLMGLALLFLIKLFLTTINGLFFTF